MQIEQTAASASNAGFICRNVVSRQIQSRVVMLHDCPVGIVLPDERFCPESAGQLDEKA